MKACILSLLIAITALTGCSKSDVVSNNNNSASNSNINQQVPNLQVDSAVAAFMSKYNIPGLSIAISKTGKMVYLKGYGYADVALKANVTISSLFRIADVSKSFTAVAIMKLIEDGKLSSIDAKVFGTNGILENSYGTFPYNTNLLNVTVRELLQETITGWQNNGNDPMFENIDLTMPDLISHTLDNNILTIPPGTKYLPSYFAYCLLGRIIEKCSKASYNDYMKVKVFESCGVGDMQLAANNKSNQKQNEVTYYGYNNEDPYGIKIGRMDAGGGWLATAQDVLKFIVSVDGIATKADMLTANSINTMITPSTANPNYACGWVIDSANNWKSTGSLPGSSVEMVRAENGYCWVILCNSRSLTQDYLTDMNNIVWSAINNKSTQWPLPNIDLF